MGIAKQRAANGDERRKNEFIVRCALIYREQTINACFEEICRMGNSVMAKEMLDRGVIDVDARFNGGITPLHLACRHGSQSIAKMLLMLGADRKAEDDMGRTPPDIARAKGYSDVSDDVMRW